MLITLCCLLLIHTMELPPFILNNSTLNGILEYSIHTKIGSPSAYLNMLMHTQSKISWLTDPTCEDCNHDNSFACNSSATCVDFNTSYQLMYQDVWASGNVINDTLTYIGNSDVTTGMQTFLDINYWDGGNKLLSDGAISLSMQDPDESYQSFIHYICSSLGNDECIANFEYNNTGASITFGPRDTKIEKSYATYTVPSVFDDRWSILLNGIKINNDKIELDDDNIALIDPSFDSIQLPHILFDQFKTIMEAKGCSEVDNYVDCPVNLSFGTLELDFDKFKITLRDKDMVIDMHNHYKRMNVINTNIDFIVIGGAVLRHGYMSLKYAIPPEVIFTPYVEANKFLDIASLTLNVISIIAMVALLLIVYKKSSKLAES